MPRSGERNESHFVGDPIGQRKGRTLYERLIHANTVYRTGEDVVVLGDAPGDSYWVAQIVALYVDSARDLSMDLRWYYRPQDLPERVPVNADRGEIFFSDHW
mmetsp:Transcript_7341/g.17581  ORF Transcript_7341/g.17581 Transcript_7341/m.17581 type:complete len:102 (-) Transcript_7341:376-681(-)